MGVSLTNRYAASIFSAWFAIGVDSPTTDDTQFIRESRLETGTTTDRYVIGIQKGDGPVRFLFHATSLGDRYEIVISNAFVPTSGASAIDFYYDWDPATANFGIAYAVEMVEVQ